METRSKKQIRRVQLGDIHPRAVAAQMITNNKNFSIDFTYWFSTELNYHKLMRKMNYLVGQKILQLGCDNSFCFVQVPVALDDGKDKDYYLEVSWVLNWNRSIHIGENKEFVRELAIELDEYIKYIECIVIKSK